MTIIALTAHADQLAAQLREHQASATCDALDPCTRCRGTRSELATIRARIFVSSIT